MSTENKPFVIAISSRALFDLSESHDVFEQQGIDAYMAYQIEHEKEILQPGVAFNLVKKLLNLKSASSNQPFFEVILVSRNSADTGLRVFNSIHAHNLPITRAAFTNGKSGFQYVDAFDAELFLSADPKDIKKALDNQIAAATIMPSPSHHSHPDEIRIALDGDSVLFSDESEQIYQKEGLDAFVKNEVQTRDIPLSAGPFKHFLSAIHQIQDQYPTDSCPIRTALVTARSAPSHERVIKTLRHWDIRIDEALFLGGMEKGVFLKAFQADFFFDDHPTHCTSASSVVPTGHVPTGITNQKSSTSQD